MNDSPDKLSNWGRWGADDVQGTLNLMTPELIRHAAGLVKSGKAYSLSVPLENEGPQWPMRQKLWRVTQFRNDVKGGGGSGDVVIMHSHSGTHIDALSHFWYHGKMYNGFDGAEHVTSDGATRNSMDNVPFIIGRGVLLDIAGWKGVEHLELGEPITADDLDQCAAAQNIRVQSGDIILLRTGWMRVFAQDRALFDSGEPGIDESTLPWLKDNDIVAIGADNHAVEVLESIPPTALPIHRYAIRDLGIYLMENFNLEELAADKAYESLVVIAPLSLTAGAGSPNNPIAIT
ncbi:MAG: cyclase family protein [Chloroflexi bacterium]|nr:cyclase family protein [Chloroflexota bacterium]